MTSDNQIPTKEKEPWHLDSNPDIKEAVERFVLWSMWENDGRKEANIPKIRDGQNRRRKARDAICQALEKELIFLRLTLYMIRKLAECAFACEDHRLKERCFHLLRQLQSLGNDIQTRDILDTPLPEVA